MAHKEALTTTNKHLRKIHRSKTHSQSTTPRKHTGERTLTLFVNHTRARNADLSSFKSGQYWLRGLRLRLFADKSSTTLKHVV